MMLRCLANLKFSKLKNIKKSEERGYESMYEACVP